jgi:hypothetical protein
MEMCGIVFGDGFLHVAFRLATARLKVSATDSKIASWRTRIAAQEHGTSGDTNQFDENLMWIAKAKLAPHRGRKS